MAAGYCKDCFTGTLRGDAKPTGTVETVCGLPAYVARPDPGQQALGIVVILPDAFGWELLNTRALADAYARRGPFLVYLPDFQAGNGIEASHLLRFDRLFGPAPWFTTLFIKPLWFLIGLVRTLAFIFSVRESVSKPRIFAFFEALRHAPPPPELAGRQVKVGAAGFCWGGRYTALLVGEAAVVADTKQPLVDCGFTAHPSLLAVPAEVEAVRRPLSLANGDNDVYMRRKKLEVVKGILESRGDIHEVVVIPGAKHGFAVRGDPRDPKQAEFGMMAEDQAVNWFRRQFTS